MILTKKRLAYWRANYFVCARLTDEQAEILLALFGKEPAPYPPFAGDEETIWITIRKMTRS